MIFICPVSQPLKKMTLLVSGWDEVRGGRTLKQ